MATPAITVNNLRKSYRSGFLGSKAAVDDLSFEIKSGSIVGFLGANGAGKSTTILSIMGLVQINSGRIEIFGVENTHSASRKKLGFCPENFRSYRTLSPFFILRYFAQLNGLSRPDAYTAALKALEIVELTSVAHQSLGTFSKGMLQRLGIAQAIVHSPELLILDEPSSGLDPDGRRMVANLISDHRKNGGTVLFSSHILSDAEKLCDQVIIMKQGKSVYSGTTPENLDQAYQHYAGKGVLA